MTRHPRIRALFRPIGGMSLGCYVNTSCLCANFRSKQGHRRAVAPLFGWVDGLADPDRYVVGCRVGDPFLRETWVSGGELCRKGAAAPEILEDTGETDRDIVSAGWCQLDDRGVISGCGPGAG